MFDNKILWRILGHEVDKARGRRRKLLRDIFHNLKLEIRNKKLENVEEKIAFRKVFTMNVQLTNLGAFSYKFKCQPDMSGT
jgi:hypothetical protein